MPLWAELQELQAVQACCRWMPWQLEVPPGTAALFSAGPLSECSWGHSTNLRCAAGSHEQATFPSAQGVVKVCYLCGHLRQQSLRPGSARALWLNQHPRTQQPHWRYASHAVLPTSVCWTLGEGTHNHDFISLLAMRAHGPAHGPAQPVACHHVSFHVPCLVSCSVSCRVVMG